MGSHGLPLMGTGDWNDGMNRVGEHGRGESVWLGWFLHATLNAFAPLARERSKLVLAGEWLEAATRLRSALEQHAWDGDWYRRGFFDDGTPLGSAGSDECRIDAIAQSWSVISGAANPARAARAMESLEAQLLRRDPPLALLFTPPFEKSLQEPGYVKAYPRGIRENGGQYTHAAVWTLIALTMQGKADRAMEVFSMLNPIRRSMTRDGCAAIQGRAIRGGRGRLSEAPHDGRGGWTWYTGSAGWLYRAGLEWILGFRLRANQLVLAPCVPAEWPGFTDSLSSSRHAVRHYGRAPTRAQCPRPAHGRWSPAEARPQCRGPGRRWCKPHRAGHLAGRSRVRRRGGDPGSLVFALEAPVSRFRRHNRLTHDRAARSPSRGTAHPCAPA